ncbi:hypothetical protein Pcinc_019875 [Petrolisthes cinctipes]|uniref:Uncharacterized protein n=1 Tax=Petrolisthes cinctipes TaxID=88211 RepID=A0AAE1FJ97_PETCI|nr:hypothetical protein Pcinc_019875 [Petrolisthes cinctipes]
MVLGHLQHLWEGPKPANPPDCVRCSAILEAPIVFYQKGFPHPLLIISSTNFYSSEPRDPRLVVGQSLALTKAGIYVVPWLSHYHASYYVFYPAGNIPYRA